MVRYLMAAVLLILPAGCASTVTGAPQRDDRAAPVASGGGTGAATDTAAASPTPTADPTTASGVPTSLSPLPPVDPSSTGRPPPDPADADLPLPGLAGSPIALFGQTFTWEDDLSITITAPVEFTPGPYASYDETAAAQVMMTVEVVNDTGTDYDPTWLDIRASSADAESESIYDSDSPVGTGGFTTVLAGRTLAFEIGFSVADPADIVVQVSPGFDYDTAIFVTERAADGPGPARQDDLPMMDPPATFGHRVALSDLVIAVSEPAALTPGEYASVDPAPHYLTFLVTLTNTGDTIWDEYVAASAQSGDREATPVYDYDAHLSGGPSVLVLPGRSISWWVGFGVADPDDVVLQIAPGFAVDTVIFTSG